MTGTRCRVCGIEHIDAGVELDGEPLCWMTEDLCSACHDAEVRSVERDAARYRFLRNRQTRAVDIGLGGVFAGKVPENTILAGEHLDRAVDAEIGAGVPHDAPLEQRLAACLADCIDTSLLIGSDGGRPLDVRLGFFRPDLSERAAELLEEAGQW